MCLQELMSGVCDVLINCVDVVKGMYVDVVMLII